MQRVAPGCTKPSMAYELGVSKYTDADTTKENGTIADNATTDWGSLLPAHVTKVPFDIWLLCRIQGEGFLEFWLNNGGISNNQSLPLQLVSFTARKQDRDVRVEWTTATETNTARFGWKWPAAMPNTSKNRFRQIRMGGGCRGGRCPQL